MNSSYVFKCICNGAISKDETCKSWSERCIINGYENGKRCKFWGQVYTFGNESCDKFQLKEE